MKNIDEQFDIIGYCNMCGMYNVDVYVNGSGIIFIIIDDGYYNFEIGNTGENAYFVKLGYRKPSTIASIKREIKKISLEINEISLDNFK